MTMTVDKCPHFDGKICTKCERSLPDYCYDHEEVERKARAYDDMVASGQIVPERSVPVAPEQVIPVKETKEEVPTVEETPAPKPHRRGGHQKKTL